MADVKAVELRAQLLRIRTRADRTADITLNVPEDCAEQVKVLFGWLMNEVGAVIVYEPPENNEDEQPGKSRKIHI